MVDNIGESMTTAITFRFTSGQILTLDEDQIEKIPYLIAMVSSADRFESARDEHGHYKLDPHIDYKHFSFVLESLPFHSVRQLFTCLPKQNDVIPIIALLDFLGIGPQPDPTLNEVDSIFFSTLVYSPMLEQYLQIVRPSVIQDMAVRFAIALAKEEYDFTKNEVIDQIYWFIMFILSAYELFGPRLRHHVYKIAEHYFFLFKPSLLKPLKKLKLRTQKDTRKLLLIKNDEDIGPDEENKRHLEQLWDLDDRRWYYRFSLFWDPPLEQRQELLLYRTYRNYRWSWYSKAPSETDLLEPVYKRVLEIMYERLQSEICRRAIAEIRRRNSAQKFETKVIDLCVNYCLLECEDLPKKIADIFKSEFVQEELRERILEEICVLTPKLEQRRAELVKKIREYEQDSERSHENEFYQLYYLLFLTTSFETMQEEALSHELILDKLHQGSSIIVEQIHQRVLDALYRVALKQFNQWENTQQDINELRQQLLSCQPPEKSPSNTSKIIHQRHRAPVNKPLPKHQLKHSTRY
jgi:hypothetical protein